MTATPWKLRPPTLASLSRRPGPGPGPQQCRICLAAETFTANPRRPAELPQSSLSDDICRDRNPCQERQPVLDFPTEEQ